MSCTAARAPSLSTQSSPTSRYAISDSFHRLRLNCQILHLWLHDFLIVTIAEFNRVGVRACFAHNIILFSQTLVHKSWQTIETAKRRHRSDCAVWNQRLELLFLAQRRALPDRLPDLVEIDLAVCGKHQHAMLFSGFYHDHFRMVPAFHVL